MEKFSYRSIFEQGKGACPICLGDSASYSYSSADIFQSGDVFRCRDKGHEFSRYDMLKRHIQSGMFGILSVFHPKEMCVAEKLRIGALDVIVLDVPAGYDVSVVAFSPGDFYQGNFLGPQKIFQQEEKLFVATIPHYQDTDRLGEQILCDVVVYLKEKTECAWKMLLYESLEDLFRGKENLSLFKMFTSLEMSMKNLLRIYLLQHGIKSSLISVIEQASWQKMVSKLSIIISDVVGEVAGAKFKKNANGNEFKDKVRGKRNDFAHSRPERFKTREVKDAFVLSFELFWQLDRAYLALTQRSDA
ncbi:hypothetical protein [Nitratidesulfovibrio termitidis]|uniref:hypothetical protein n=1 Tax=Nitratidesulfovibrio termitidis TaxID=42252 RepID=UPI0012EB685E|nr:hypothetical protein [Nitratidesulfovibrio termitidis]